MSAKDSIFDENGPGLADFLPDTSSGYTAYAGESLKEPVPADKADIIEALKTVKDPEIPVNIY
ncbi:MAG: SUF system Fe-S cluster assembly protein, partial [Proteobacteria bacterium]|nr:SUF system Fe-S cluster assembly protein [Pseudomonadota bacterium]